MKHITRIIFVLCILSRFGDLPVCLADDLDDGIPIDDSISEYDQIGDSIDQNYSYLALRAQSNAAARTGEMEDALYTNGGSILNSVILQAGSNVQGDIIIIDQSIGDRTIIAQ